MENEIVKVCCPRVSIVMPVYNAQDGLLKRAIGSVFAQTEQSFELVLVDDGSCNGCIDRIPEEFRCDSRLKIIRQNNSGIEGALDTGIKNSSGEFFYVVAQDDFAHPQTLEYCLNVILAEQADFCIFYGFSQRDYEMPKCKVIADFDSIPRKVFSYTQFDAEQYARALESLNMDAWGHFVRMSLVHKVRKMWPLYDGVARVHLMLTVANRWIRSSARLYYYNTVNPDSITKKAITSVFIERSWLEFKKLRDIYESADQNGEIWKAVRRLYVVKGVKMVVNLFRRRNKICSKELNKKCLDAMGGMLKDFFTSRMLRITEINFRMYLYYQWIILRYSVRKKDNRLSVMSLNSLPEAFLSDFGCVLNDQKKRVSKVQDNKHNQNEARILNFPVHGDHKGSLVALEKGDDFPFEIKRVYYIWGTSKDVVRGHHAHRNLEQVIVCTSGSCDFILDDGSCRKIYHLDSPSQGLHIKNNVWREFTNFSSDCVVMVLASEHYNEADYIRDYNEFLDVIGKGG